MGVIIGMDPLKRSATANWLVKDPVTGKPTEDWGHKHHIWNVDTVKALVANQDAEATFFCGGLTRKALSLNIVTIASAAARSRSRSVMVVAAA